jgi:hypothetical protein
VSSASTRGLGNELFRAALTATRLDPVVAPFTVRRLLLRVGVRDVDHLTPAELERALPHFRSELPRFLLTGDDCERAITDLEQLSHSPATRDHRSST